MDKSVSCMSHFSMKASFPLVTFFSNDFFTGWVTLVFYDFTFFLGTLPMAMQWEHLQLHLDMIFPFEWFEESGQPVLSEFLQGDIFEIPFLCSSNRLALFDKDGE